MKKVCLFLLLMFNVFIASAQFTVAPELGLSALSYNGAGVGWKPAIKVGASVEYMFQSNFSIESGLFYTQRGYSKALVDITHDIYKAEAPSLVRHLLQMPIHARYSWNIADETRLFVSAGPYIGLYLANNWKNTQLYKDSRAGNTFDWGFSASAGVEVKRMFFRLGYDISLGNEFGDGVAVRYNVGTLSVGYKF